MNALRFLLMAPALIIVSPVPHLFSQTPADEDYRAFNDSPRLLLTRQRLRLLQRERERQSMRWQQFDTLVTSGAPMPEPGFALGLYYRVSGNSAVGRRAVDWAIGEGSDLRQLALVFDWCGPVMSKTQADQLAAKLERGLASATNDASHDIREQDGRALAAIALADRLPDQGESVLRPLVQKWWRENVVKRITSPRSLGDVAIPREQAYVLYELMHALRDNLKIDLRESAPDFFKNLPIDHLVGHYPSPFQGPENEYHVPVYVHNGEPDLTDAVLSRAAEFAMVAYDDNAPESQYLQGWLIQDRFLMRGPLGAPYEFLWANPYQPGLNYDNVPLIFHDPATGHVFARTNWDEDATWIGYFDGHLQLFQDGQIQTLKAGAATKPVRVGTAVLLSAQKPDAVQFHADSETIFVLSLKPQSHYDVEIDDEELSEMEADAGGTLVLTFPEGADAGVRIRLRNE